ncbi:MAG: cupredoxin domain-containing protein [Acidobacteriota bacterium]
MTEHGYEPVSIQLKRGVPAQITFLRMDENNCGEKFLLKELGIQKSLLVGQPVIVELTPEKTGDYSFTCGMGMYRGTLTVID